MEPASAPYMECISQVEVEVEALLSRGAVWPDWMGWSRVSIVHWLSLSANRTLSTLCLFHILSRLSHPSRAPAHSAFLIPRPLANPPSRHSSCSSPPQRSALQASPPCLLRTVILHILPPSVTTSASTNLAGCCTRQWLSICFLLPCKLSAYLPRRHRTSCAMFRLAPLHRFKYGFAPPTSYIIYAAIPYPYLSMFSTFQLDNRTDVAYTETDDTARLW